MNWFLFRNIIRLIFSYHNILSFAASHEVAFVSQKHLDEDEGVRWLVTNWDKLKHQENVVKKSAERVLYADLSQ